MLDHGARDGVADDSGDQVELVVVNEHQRGVWSRLRQLDHLLRHQHVHLHVTVRPRLVDAFVHDRFVAQVPEVVLDEPQHRVGDDRVVHHVLLTRWGRVVEPARAPREPHLQPTARG